MTYYDEVIQIAQLLNKFDVRAVTDALKAVRERKGRVFAVGVGGSSANASHLTNDLRKLCNIEAYCVTDNAAELTARTNDDGWESVFVEWLKVSRITKDDCVFVLSVGGGDWENNVSVGLVHALDHAKEVGATILGIVGRTGGYTAKVADACVIVPAVNPEYVTPHTESFAVTIFHGIVWDLKVKQGTWEAKK